METNGTEHVELAGELAEARRSLTELRQEQRLYRELFENSLGLMCVHDLDGVLLNVNPAAAQSLGFRPEEGVGVNMKRFLAPPIQHLFDAYLDRIRRNGSDAGLMRLLARDGGERIWLYRNVLYEEPGTPPRVLGHAQDITERMRAEEALKESERRFRNMADTAPVFIWMCDTGGECLFVNKAWLDFSGRTQEQELGRGWAEGLHPEDRERGRADFARAIARRESFRAEYRMRRADGEYRWILDTGTPRFNSDGQYAGFIGSCVDVTEARQDREALRIAHDELAVRVEERTAELLRANEALRESEQHYQVLTNLAPVGIFRTDVNGRCVYLNDRACQICGINLEEGGTGRWDRILEADDRVRLAAEWRKVVAGGGPGSLEHRIVRRDGSAVWALTHFAAERGLRGRDYRVHRNGGGYQRPEAGGGGDPEAGSAGATCTAAAKPGHSGGGPGARFQQSADHHFRKCADCPVGPATGIAGSGASGRDRDGHQPGGGVDQPDAGIFGQGRFTLQAVNLSRLAEEIAHLLQAVISRKTAIQFNLAGDLPAIDADPAQIRQIVMNLITNAAEAIGEGGGAIQVSTGVVDADRTYLSGTYFDDRLPAGRYVYLEVADTGCGMSPETQTRIFDPFFTTKFTGRGLGLAAAIGIVRAHRGALKVTSQPGLGSTFRLLFPGTDKKAEVRLAEPAGRVWRGRGTVLVVDDESGVRDLARAILENSGFTVLTACDGGDAIRIFRRHAGEVVAIVLDLTMPAMTGEEAATELQRIRAGVPIILSSGYSEQEVAGRFAGKGLAGFLQKPYEPAALTEALLRALEHRVVG